MWLSRHLAHQLRLDGRAYSPPVVVVAAARASPPRVVNHLVSTVYAHTNNIPGAGYYAMVSLHVVHLLLWVVNGNHTIWPMPCLGQLSVPPSLIGRETDQHPISPEVVPLSGRFVISLLSPCLRLLLDLCRQSSSRREVENEFLPVGFDCTRLPEVGWQQRGFGWRPTVYPKQKVGSLMGGIPVCPEDA